MSHTHFKLNNPSTTEPVVLQKASSCAAETAYQVGDGEYFFKLATGGSNSNSFIGPVSINNPAASLTVNGPISGTAALTVPTLSTNSVTSAGPLDLNGTTVSVNGLNAINLTTTAPGAGMTLSSSGSATISSTQNISIETGSGSFNLNTTGTANTQIGQQNAAGNLTLYGNIIKFQTGSIAAPLEVEYGVPFGDVGYLYDTKTNPVAGSPVLVGAYTNSYNIIQDGPYTPPFPGYYVVTTTCTYAPQGGVSDLAFNSNYITTCLTTNNSTYIPIAGTSALFLPVGVTATGNAAVIAVQTSIAYLNSVPIYSDLAFLSGTGKLGTGGGITTTIQPLGCVFS